MNVTTQDEQVAVSGNAAAHLEPGGRFVVELIVPELRGVPPGEAGRVFRLDQDHVGIETFDDLVGQIAWSHPLMEVGGRDGQARRVPPRASLDRAGPGPTSDSKSQVAVFEKAS